MKEARINFKTAKLAKEKGVCKYFENIDGTKYVPAFYSEDGINFEETEFQQEDCTIGDRYFRPTQSLLQRLLREVHNIDVNFEITDGNKYFFIVRDKSKTGCPYLHLEESPIFNKAEEALEVGLFKGLELIKN